MSLVTQISDLATRVGTEIKAVQTKIGTLSSLTTTDKTSVVAAINEVQAEVGSGGGGATINDSAASTTEVYSSQKTTDLVNAKPSINDGATNTTTVWSGSKTNTTINSAVATKPSIDDVTPATTSVYSATKTDSQIQAAKDAILGGAGAAYDTLAEIQALMAADDTETTGIMTALGLRVRVDASQSFDATQQAQGRNNIGAQKATDIGDTTRDFVTDFETALL